jgi:hypothetical protein
LVGNSINGGSSQFLDAHGRLLVESIEATIPRRYDDMFGGYIVHPVGLMWLFEVNREL